MEEGSQPHSQYQALVGALQAALPQLVAAGAAAGGGGAGGCSMALGALEDQGVPGEDGWTF